MRYVLMFSVFEMHMMNTARGVIRVRTGGEGAPLLLLHGHPRTHMTWGQVADRLSPFYRLVCPDVPGFGKSYVPEDANDSYNSSKREKAAALIDLMQQLGYDKFHVVGHDRGSYVAFRMAMEHPNVVRKLVVIDCLPIVEHLDRIDWMFARDWYHWFFFAQPDKPERVISADPLGWYNKLSPELMGADAYRDLIHVLHNPKTIHGMVEDYRAGIRIDHIHDREDRAAGRKVACATLCLWSMRDDLEQLYGDPVAIWKNWADDVHGFGIDSGHHMAEENPNDLTEALLAFLK